jgi:hypothetical protein
LSQVEKLETRFAPSLQAVTTEVATQFRFIDPRCGGEISKYESTLSTLDRTSLLRAYFEFHDVKPGVAYEIRIHAKDFADSTSPSMTLEPGQFKIVTGIQLRIQTQRTSIGRSLRCCGGRDGAVKN